MAANRWIFTVEQLSNTPSRKCGIDSEKESSYRQQAASLIQDMGQKLQVTQLCINTAIVYMHRFYMFHSFAKFSRTSMAGACLFLAAKVEEQPRKLEHVIRTSYMCDPHHRDKPQLDVKSDAYLELAQELVIDENILLQTLGFEITVDHPHTHIVKTCTLVRASKDLAQTSYFLATNSLHLTSMCLRYPPTIVACVCIHLACKWSSFEIPQSSEGKAWYYYVDASVTSAMLEEITQDFLAVYEKCPSKMRRKLTNHKSSMEEFSQHASERKLSDRRPGMASATAAAASSAGLSFTHLSDSKEKAHDREANNGAGHRYTNHERIPGHQQPSAAATLSSAQPPVDQPDRPFPVPVREPASGQVPLRRVKTELSAKEYFERRERERLERDAAKVDLKPSKDYVRPDQPPVVTSPADVKPNPELIKVEVETGKVGQVSDIINHSQGLPLSKEHTKVRPEMAKLGYNMAMPDNSPKLPGQRPLKAGPTAANRIAGNPSDPVNIFDRFQSSMDAKQNMSSEQQINQRAISASSDAHMPPLGGSYTAEMSAASATQLDLDMILKPEHVHGGILNLPITAAVSGQAAAVGGHGVLQSQHGQSLNGGHKLSHGIPNDAQMEVPGAERMKERRRSGRRDSSGTPVKQRPVLGQPANTAESAEASVSNVKYVDQRSSRQKHPIGASQPSPLKLKLAVPSATNRIDSPAQRMPTDVLGAANAHSRIPHSGVAVDPSGGHASSAIDPQQERIRLKLNVSGGKVEKLTDVGAASSAPAAPLSGVKLILSKDKRSGEYQPGGVGHEAGHHHRHRHHSHSHHHSKHSRPGDARQPGTSESRKRPGDDEGLQRPPPDKQHRLDASLDNGHHMGVPGRPSQHYQQQPFHTSVDPFLHMGISSHVPSTYRLTSGSLPPPPPPPPPPLPCDNPSSPPPPPPLPQNH